jgi:hypothetical protein
MYLRVNLPVPEICDKLRQGRDVLLSLLLFSGRGVNAVFASAFVLIISALLFLYWVRYVCLLILSDGRSRDYTRDVAQANGLAFLQTRTALETSRLEQAAFDALQKSLDRDYRLVTYLLRHAARNEARTQDYRQWFLRLNYRLLAFWYAIARRLSASLARSVLLEMSSVVAQLANAMGERCALTARA